MEILLPTFALASLYLINKSSSSTQETFVNNTADNILHPYTQTNNTPAVIPEAPVSNYKTTSFYDKQQPVPSSSTFHSLAGNKVDSTYFQHNNMIPFIGGNLRNLHTEASANESILDSYSGTGSQNLNKKEISPLFSPQTNTQYNNGTPNSNDFYQSRVNPSRNMANIKPFESQQVAPGLGLGYTTEGSGGFNSGLAQRENWLDRGVDDMRVLTRPKASGMGLLGHEGPAVSAVKELGTLGVQEKHRPDTMFAMNADRYFTTTGIQKGERNVETTVLKNVSRPETTVSYEGIANATHKAEYVVGEYMPSHNVELGSFPLQPVSAAGKGFANEADYQAKSATAYNNNRSVVKQQDYFGAVGGSIHETIAPLMDILKPSRKENTVGTLRPYQNPKSTVASNYIYNPNDKTKTTLRETTENSPFHLNIDSNHLQRGGAYESTPHQAVDNARMTTGDFFYAGNSSAADGSKQMRRYDAEYAQRNNDVKSSTNVGYTPSGNTNMFNNNINMTTSADRDNQMHNQRDVAPRYNGLAPDTAFMGRSSQSVQQNYTNMGLDRNNGDVLSQLNSNPYAIRSL